MDPLCLSDVCFSAASPVERARGLVGYVSATVNGSLSLDGLTLRRTRAGRLALSFPARRDSKGDLHPVVRPLTDAVRREVERQIFEALGLTEGAL
jgi:DNA-binding cell septation regulator SpoVG